jgi:hypothetical protein
MRLYIYLFSYALFNYSNTQITQHQGVSIKHQLHFNNYQNVEGT